MHETGACTRLGRARDWGAHETGACTRLGRARDWGAHETGARSRGALREQKTAKYRTVGMRMTAVMPKAEAVVTDVVSIAVNAELNAEANRSAGGRV